MGMGAEFLRAVARLGGLGCLTRLFPKARQAALEAVDVALPEQAEEVLRPHVERRIGPIFRRVGLDLAPRLELLTFAILHRTWEAQRVYLETVAEEIDRAEKERHAKRR